MGFATALEVIHGLGQLGMETAAEAGPSTSIGEKPASSESAQESSIRNNHNSNCEADLKEVE
ncbi:hypothetical protein C1H46_014814 [Malus baccata]|uniref:Uncharacterized protein n=1 Tax=Malus baccata TaxID=106549 RepID=A0A540MLD8_MALBA|nr:hypothetical protein C1H46_014814 [Malus baccata]